jgi:hypothetical protein
MENTLLKAAAAVMCAVGSFLFTFSFFGFSVLANAGTKTLVETGWYANASVAYDMPSRYRMAIGVAMVILGLFLRPCARDAAR